MPEILLLSGPVLREEVKTYLRNGAPGLELPTAMDDLGYKYYYYDANGVRKEYDKNDAFPTDVHHLTNQLASVSDAVVGSSYEGDIEGQDPENYEYDKIGNLIIDNKADDDNSRLGMKWTPYGKISYVLNYTNGAYSMYRYDPSGNRIYKAYSGTETSYTNFYIRDAQGNVLAVYEDKGGQFTWKEQHLYGSSRLGMVKPDVPFTANEYIYDGEGDPVGNYIVGKRAYELSNHLGNVLSTISDIKTGHDDGEGGIDYYTAEVLSQHDYYPFGSLMPGRKFSSNLYRYGFNGKENDNEVKGEGNAYDFGERIQDPRLGRFLSVDALEKKFPDVSPYSFAGNRPTSAIDVKGDSLYILFYTQNSSLIGGEDMFRAAAITRAYDIKHSGNFDASRDKVVVLGIQDVSDIQKKIGQTVAESSKTYGKTVEFSIWSHASFDGPVGTIDASENSLGWGTNQMNPEGWSKIDFNWANEGSGCRAIINGCRTGEDPAGEKASFVTELSAMQNFKNVTVEGPSTYSYPSRYVDEKVKTGTTNGSRVINDKNGVITVHSTYMIPLHSTKKQWFVNHLNVQPMRFSVNGKGVLGGNQAGDKAPAKPSVRPN